MAVAISLNNLTKKPTISIDSSIHGYHEMPFESILELLSKLESILSKFAGILRAVLSQHYHMPKVRGGGREELPQAR